MATHGAGAYFAINDGSQLRDISPYVNNTDVDRTQDEHDTTTYGDTGHEFIAGLTNGQITITGLWDDTASVGSRTVFKALVVRKTPTAFEWGPEGDGTGAEKITGNCIVTSYRESAPVADLVTFAATLRISGAVTDGTFS